MCSFRLAIDLCPTFFVGTYASQRLVSVLWISMSLGLPRFMLGLVGFSFGEHPLISQAVETVATIAQSTSHF